MSGNGESRSEQLYVRVRPTVRTAIEADAAKLGQSLATWVERACMAREVNVCIRVNRSSSRSSRSRVLMRPCWIELKRVTQRCNSSYRCSQSPSGGDELLSEE